MPSLSPQLIIPTQREKGTEMFRNVDTRRFWAVDPKNLDFDLGYHRGLWVGTTLRVFGTRAQLRDAGLAPAPSLPSSPLQLRDENEVVEGFFVKGRGYDFDDPKRVFGMMFLSAERPGSDTEGAVMCLRVDLDEGEMEEERRCPAWGDSLGFEMERLQPILGAEKEKPDVHI